MTLRSQSIGASSRRFKYTDFDVPAIEAGTRKLTDEEREFLIQDTPRFEEGMHLTTDELRVMSDPELIRTAYTVWADYASTQV
jgi:hypothetical protein